MKTAMLGLLNPLSKRHALDPFEIKKYRKTAPFRLIWTLQSRLLEFFATNLVSKKIRMQKDSLRFFSDTRGAEREDTSVTTVQLELLLKALKEAGSQGQSIVEIGSYRGVTTIELAGITKGQIYAVDPFSGYGGSEVDLREFKKRTFGSENVILLRETSGAASRRFPKGALGFVFIDGVHDFSNSWFDFCAWSEKVADGGMILFHDVDDHPGVRLTVREIIKKSPEYQIWGYCPNLIAFKKQITR